MKREYAVKAGDREFIKTFQDELLLILVESTKGQRGGTNNNGHTIADIANQIWDNKENEPDYKEYVKDRSKGAFLKQVERDMARLEGRGKIIRDDKTKRYRINPQCMPLEWFASARAQLGKRLMPEGLFDAMERIRDQDAEDDGSNKKKSAVLPGFDKTSYYRWIEKFRLINHNTFGFRSYKHVDNSVYQGLAQALLRERKIKIAYRASTKDKTQWHHVSPLGLVFLGQEQYLVCKFGGNAITDVRKLAISRIDQVVSTDYPLSNRCKDFDLDKYIDGGYFEFSDKTFDLANPAANSPSQRDSVKIKCKSQTTFERIKELLSDIEMSAEATNILQFKAYISLELERWVLSQHELIEVLEPTHFREEIRRKLQAAAKLYP